MSGQQAGARRWVSPGRRSGVAKLRAELGLTQAAFAGELGVRQQTVSEWETGRYRPRGASARLLQFFADERFVYDRHPSPPPPEPPADGGEP